MLDVLISTATTVLGWLPGWVLLALVAAAVVAGMLAGGLTRAATVLLAVATLAGIGGWELRDLRQADADRQAAQDLSDAVQAARAEEQAKTTAAERIANDHATRQKDTLDRAVYAERAVQRLRDEIDRLNARDLPEDAGAAAAAREARAARGLLGECAGRYRAVDERAQQLGDQVTGLQDFVAAVCRAEEADER